MCWTAMHPTPGSEQYSPKYPKRTRTCDRIRESGTHQPRKNYCGEKKKRLKEVYLVKYFEEYLLVGPATITIRTDIVRCAG
jgi:hypothetical protein